MKIIKTAEHIKKAIDIMNPRNPPAFPISPNGGNKPKQMHNCVLTLMGQTLDIDCGSHSSSIQLTPEQVSILSPDFEDQKPQQMNSLGQTKNYAKLNRTSQINSDNRYNSLPNSMTFSLIQEIGQKIKKLEEEATRSTEQEKSKIVSEIERIKQELNQTISILSNRGKPTPPDGGSLMNVHRPEGGLGKRII